MKERLGSTLPVRTGKRERECFEYRRTGRGGPMWKRRPHLSRQLVTVLTSPPPATSAAHMPQPDLRSFFRSLWLRAASLLPSPPEPPADAHADAHARNPRQPHTAAVPPAADAAAAAAAPNAARTAENGTRKRPGLARDLRHKSKSQPNMRKFTFKARFSSSSTALHKAPAAQPEPEPVPPDSRFLVVPPPTGHTTGGREPASERGRPPSPRLVPPPASRFSQRLSGGSLSLFPPLSSSAPTPALSYTTNTPSTVSLAFSPETPLDPSTPYPDANDLYAIAELVTATTSDADLGALAQRRGFRGARLFTAADPLRTLSTALSPRSPLFAGAPALRRISDAVWGPHAPSATAAAAAAAAAHQGARTAPDPFATHGESYYTARAEPGPFADIYDLAAYARARHRRRRTGETRTPRAKAGKSRVNVYVVSMYDARAPSPSRRKSNADAAAVAAATTRHASVACPARTASVASLPARAKSKAAPGTGVARASVAAIAEAEELLDKEYLRSLARAFFTPESSPRTSVASLCTERRQSKGLRPLVLPQQLGLAGAGGGDAPCVSEPRNESALRRSLQERRRSGPTATMTTTTTTTTTIVERGGESPALGYEWDESMESEVMRLGW
ncbi:hypothetical protein HETIRDRAFT_448242 [Heterobasidion irregulare TC 32-1]|uniref:Uncharacterized protein n=1 Tax=Heterobasidion irregulare (strain TC 32-1) TaxID=747525 RepID=W4KPS3_HETIT|nr:uncharacterized protein HETIRDRAFT_448242 [Heterobasidion irregulare TC 32-1]ETW87828.1 hypothetical protein HETIRDRAFT_448242 [Heterobasidion irregulare TC 32-1]